MNITAAGAYSILLVDDDERIGQFLAKYLRNHDFTVAHVSNAREAEEALNYISFDLLIVDVMMPGITGVEFTSNLRRKYSVPVIMLSAVGDAQARIAGLESGADDYLAKPFEPEELLWRIKRLIARAFPASLPNLQMIGKYQCDLGKQLLVGPEESISLSTSETKLLAILLENRGKVITRKFLAEALGGINERSVDVQIIRLRQKLEPDVKRPIYLRTIRYHGYSLS